MCGHTDTRDRKQYVPPLSGDKRITCLSFREFIEILYKRRSTSFKTRGSHHWQRQYHRCGADKITYDDIIKLETINRESFWPLFGHLRVSALSFPHVHAEHHRHLRGSGSSKFYKKVPKTQLHQLQELVEKIYAIYAKDYTVYNYTHNKDHDTLYLWKFFKDTPTSCLSSNGSEYNKNLSYVN